MIESDADVPYVFDQSGKKQMLSPEGDEEYFFTKGMRRIAEDWSTRSGGRILT